MKSQKKKYEDMNLAENIVEQRRQMQIQKRLRIAMIIMISFLSIMVVILISVIVNLSTTEQAPRSKPERRPLYDTSNSPVHR